MFLLFVLLIIIIFILIKSATKLMKVSFVIVLIVIVLIYLTSSMAFEKEVIDFTKVSGMAKATKVYFLWIFSFLPDSTPLTGSIVDNSSNNSTNASQS